MKSQDMHAAAVAIISETMSRLINMQDPEKELREMNMDVFLQQLNHELMQKDPTIA